MVHTASDVVAGGQEQLPFFYSFFEFWARLRPLLENCREILL